MIVVVIDGSAVLGLGSIGSRAAMTVMERKAVLFKELGNVDTFPGIFRGALDVRAKDINEDIKHASVYTITRLLTDNILNEENTFPDVLDKNVAIEVSRL